MPSKPLREQIAHVICGRGEVCDFADNCFLVRPNWSLCETTNQADQILNLVIERIKKAENPYCAGCHCPPNCTPIWHFEHIRQAIIEDIRRE